MKTIYSIIVILFVVLNFSAQAPEKFSYQAVIRNTSNALVTNQLVGMQFSILQGSTSGSAVYIETQTTITNLNGLASLEIGNGTVISGTFSTIDWSNGPYFIKTETDPLGGNNYTISGITQLLSVPYALYAKTSGSAAPGTALGNTSFWNGTQWVVNDNFLYNNGNQIGINNPSPNPSAIIDINSTTKGILPPRMTTTERNAIVTPAQGLMIYNTSSNCFEVWSGSSWMSLCEGACVPSPTQAIAGPDQNSTGPITVTLQANSPAIGTGSWTIQSGVGGVIANASNPNSSFSGNFGSSYTLQWSISNGCGISSDIVNISFGCPPNFANCNGLAIDGCEVNIGTSASNCGACGNVCLFPNATSTCLAGSCAIASCVVGYANCNGITADGCEVNVLIDSNNCGACGNACPSGMTCVNGICQ